MESYGKSAKKSGFEGLSLSALSLDLEESCHEESATNEANRAKVRKVAEIWKTSKGKALTVRASLGHQIQQSTVAIWASDR